MNSIITVSKDLKHIILYALILAILVFLLKWLQWKFLIVDNAIDIYVGLIAVFFTALGIWVATQLVGNKVQIIKREPHVAQPNEFKIDTRELEKLNLTSREYEVLQLLTKGYSNAAIAESLFLSVSTIKTHVSNLLTKLGVKSRTQAIEKSKRLKLIP